LNKVSSMSDRCRIAAMLGTMILLSGCGMPAATPVAPGDPRPSPAPEAETIEAVSIDDLARAKAPSPEPRKAAPDVGPSGFRMTRKDGFVYLLKSYKSEGKYYKVVDIKNKVTQHLIESVKSIERLASGPWQVACADYDPPGTENSKPKAKVKAKKKNILAGSVYSPPASGPGTTANRSSSADSGLCGSPTKTTGEPCRNRVSGGGYCYLHR
jgi:hypothetical protein